MVGSSDCQSNANIVDVGVASFDKQRKNHKRSADNKPEPFVLLSYASRRRLSHSSAVSVVSLSLAVFSRMRQMSGCRHRFFATWCRQVSHNQAICTRPRKRGNEKERFGFRCRQIWIPMQLMATHSEDGGDPSSYGRGRGRAYQPSSFARWFTLEYHRGDVEPDRKKKRTSAQSQFVLDLELEGEHQ